MKTTYGVFSLIVCSLFVNQSNAQSLIPPSEGLRFVDTGNGIPKWMSKTQLEIISEKVHSEGKCGGYMDITDYFTHYQEIAHTAEPIAFEILRGEPNPRFRGLVNRMLLRVNRQNIHDSVQKLSSWRNRYYQSKTGVEAAQWIADQYQSIANKYKRPDVQVELFKHRFKQPSVIVRVPGKGPNRREIVVIGSHLDSIRSRSGSSNMDAPGADDNASGTSTAIEIFRVLMETRFVPSRTIEFMGYAGEEKGLLGSQDIARKYKRYNKRVVAALQFDMTGYPGSGDRMILISDHVNAQLTNFVEKLIKTYVKVPVVRDKCNYPCSDHASWTRNGFASAFPFESKFRDSNGKIHSPKDVIDLLKFNHIERYAKLGVAFAVELGKPR